MSLLLKAPDWNRQGANWPNRTSSQFVETINYRWHIQRTGQGPQIVLLHGTGAASHSWSGLFPLLAKKFDVITLDLPGHGFTKSLRHRIPSLPVISTDIENLLSSLMVRPVMVIGHSAGAAIMAHMATSQLIKPDAVVSINGALTAFEGAAGIAFPLAAKLLYYNPFSALAFAQGARNPRRVAKLIEQTGSSSTIDTLPFYSLLLGNAAHISGTLGMMAHWDLSKMEECLKGLTVPALFIAGLRDKAVPPKGAKWAACVSPKGALVEMTDVGHLAHEEAPEETAKLIVEFAGRNNIF